MRDDKNIKTIKTLEKIEQEIEHLNKLDKKKRRYGESWVYRRITGLLEEAKVLMIGEGCEFYQEGNCKILNEPCDVICKEECPLRIKTLKENEVKHNNKHEFERIEDYKKVKKEAIDETVD